MYSRLGDDVLSYRVPAAIVAVLLVAAAVSTFQRPPWDPELPVRLGLGGAGLLLAFAVGVDGRRGPDKYPLGNREQNGEEYGLVLHDDDTHAERYVVGLLTDVCGLGPRASHLLTARLHAVGRVLAHVGTWGDCEELRRKVEERGPDPDVDGSTGPLRATVEKLAEVSVVG